MKQLLLSIGAMKAGTTWLYDKLKQHPDIVFGFEKEIHYFAQKYGVANPLSQDKRIRRMRTAMRKDILKGEEMAMLLRKIDWYSEYLSNPVDDDWFLSLFGSDAKDGKYLADFSNLNCHLKREHWKEVLNCFPQTRILYIMRDPLHRIWSHFKYHLQFSGSDLRKMPDSDNQLFQSILKKEWFRRNAEYAEVVARLRDVVPPSNLLLIYFEDMVTRPSETLRTIECFLDISHLDFQGVDLMKRKNSSIDVPIPTEWRQQITDMYRDEFARIRETGLWHPAWQNLDI